MSQISVVQGAERIPDFSVSDQEIVDLVDKLRQEDASRAVEGQIILDYQGHTTTHNADDHAKNRLFKWVDPNLLKKNTYQKLVALYDEYQPRAGIREENSIKKTRIIREYLDAILDTQIWKSLYEFLHQKEHLFATTPNEFRSWINQLWFVEYSRHRGLIDSSGFEHVFMGEVFSTNFSNVEANF
ncbi:unnamed protein product [Thelazia callipaeda]|uniref:Endoribonuclease n=1 Tax=Thelazia callipaeda TaxID=103827 RepID=A0A0N5CTI1_THECL|nr:unnamed protein product [Thelazia callipaeda]